MIATIERMIETIERVIETTNGLVSQEHEARFDRELMVFWAERQVRPNRCERRKADAQWARRSLIPCMVRCAAVGPQRLAEGAKELAGGDGDAGAIRGPAATARPCRKRGPREFVPFSQRSADACETDTLCVSIE